ncbi:hypothetical protein GCK32_004739 [Trichostrongylus colubriformis]|uniref:Uncharacterized protein n=1 Tax=Trichostrongylus colubriformis TaxID=6319 RepID=A0AAN8FND2_TRICO
MSDQIAGFDYENVAQNKKIENQQETVNRTVLSKMLKIIGIPNAERKSVKELVKKFLNEIVKYVNKDDNEPLGWVQSAGGNGDSMNIKAEMSSAFWTFYVDKGRRHLLEYNRINGTSIKVYRGQTLHVSDLESLSLYLRRRIRSYCVERKLLVPEVTVKGSYLTMINHSSDSKESSHGRKRECDRVENIPKIAKMSNDQVC